MTYDGLGKMGKTSFVWAVLEWWLNREPTVAEEKVTEAMWVAVLDHEGSPSSIAAAEARAQGKSLSEVVAAGVMTINEQHGGAIAGLVRILKERSETSVEALVSEYLREGKRLPGFGHRVYKTEDPRAIKLLELAREYGFEGEYIKRVLEIEAELEKQKGVKLVLNIDGAMAAILAEMNVSADKVNAWFILPRVAGMLR